MDTISSHKFSYLDLSDIEQTWRHLFSQVPTWITELRKPKYEPVSKEVENRMIADGKKDEVIRRNMRFVTNISRHYHRAGMEIWDVISAGNVGLVESYNTFDPTVGTKFITYAVNRIRAKMIDELRNSNNIKLSSTQTLMLRDYIDCGGLEEMVSRFPKRYSAQYDTLSRNLQEILSIVNMVRLDNPYKDGSLMELPSIVKTALTVKQLEILEFYMDEKLSPFENELLRMSFGLFRDNDPSSIREIATKFNTNPSKVAKIRKNALNKLKELDPLKTIFDNHKDISEIKYAHSKNTTHIE